MMMFDRCNLTRPMTVICVAISCVWPLLSHAGEILIDQKDTQFWFQGKGLNPGDVVPGKVGDTLRIMNSDNVTHNSFSLSEKLFFDAGSQKPSYKGGKEILVKIQNPGKFEVACAIHPQMGFTLSITS